MSHTTVPWPPTRRLPAALSPPLVTAAIDRKSEIGAAPRQWMVEAPVLRVVSLTMRGAPNMEHGACHPFFGLRRSQLVSIDGFGPEVGTAAVAPPSPSCTRPCTPWLTPTPHAPPLRWAFRLPARRFHGGFTVVSRPFHLPPLQEADNPRILPCTCVTERQRKVYDSRDSVAEVCKVKSGGEAVFPLGSKPLLIKGDTKSPPREPEP